MGNVFKIAELLVDNVKNNYASDVAIIAYYGSYALNEASPTSDLDMFYIPVDGKRPPLYRSFIYEGLPFEFWPVSWQFAEKIASFKHSFSVAPSLIANAKILYYRNEEDLNRFIALQKKIADLNLDDNKGSLLNEAIEAYKQIPFLFDNINLSIEKNDIASIRIASLDFINQCVDCLCLVNQIYFTRVWYKNYEKLNTLNKKPVDFANLVKTIITSSNYDDIINAAEKIKKEIRNIILNEQKLVIEEISYQDMFDGAYPGFLEHVNKVLSACNKKDKVALTTAISKIQNEFTSMIATINDKTNYSNFNIYQEYRKFYDELELIDLVSLFETNDFNLIEVKIKELFTYIKKVLLENNVKLNDFANLDDLKSYIYKQ